MANSCNIFSSSVKILPPILQVLKSRIARYCNVHLVDAVDKKNKFAGLKDAPSFMRQKKESKGRSIINGQSTTRTNQTDKLHGSDKIHVKDWLKSTSFIIFWKKY